MHEGAAAPSYLRPGLGIRRAGVSVRKQCLRTSSRAKRGLRNPQGRLCGSRLEALWASKSPKATATAKSEILTPRRRSGPGGRFRYHFLAAAKGSKKMMQLEKMKNSFFRRVLTLSTPRGRHWRRPFSFLPKGETKMTWKASERCAILIPL